mmetsp:Transcript_643/g.1889  ORF Transcript_643/g.1889 Transcript_643/m.1889 type:complete len:218 (-) Transcript_643:164-817(-)
MNPPSKRIVHSNVDKGVAPIIFSRKPVITSLASLYSSSKPMIQSVSMASMAVAPRCPKSFTLVFVTGSSSSSPKAYFLYPRQACFMASLTAARLSSLTLSLASPPPRARAATAFLYPGVGHDFPSASPRNGGRSLTCTAPIPFLGRIFIGGSASVDVDLSTSSRCSVFSALASTFLLATSRSFFSVSCSSFIFTNSCSFSLSFCNSIVLWSMIASDM